MDRYSISAAKRSIVIHAANGQGERIACADLIPYGENVKSYELSFLAHNYDRFVDYTNY